MCSLQALAAGEGVKRKRAGGGDSDSDDDKDGAVANARDVYKRRMNQRAQD